MVLVSIVAFVINVGLFVKAKINLQNATDAAAFAGAAVQARQLSKIAHLNWEMRNIYKEWLYKYYVVGNLNIKGVTDITDKSDTGMMNFTMEPDIDVLKSDPVKGTTYDNYNLPSVCIHLENSETNICRRYAIPGLPEFGSSNLSGAEAASRAFQDALITTKVNDCIERTKLNMMVASMWAYNVKSNSANTFASNGPAIMGDRQGAWPRAIELALRIRNLEKVVNREPENKGICVNPGTSSAINCSAGIDTYSSQAKMGNERIVKAFYSGFRNIGGSYEGDEMKNSFTLTELQVDRVTYDKETNASVLLIPGSRKSEPKYFLDLKLMMVNYAIFYSAMIPRADESTSGACDVSKAAIPVPGYPLGFYKNPNVLTYYAVKGEAEFIGMFNPFSEPIKMTAYAAAKPMGGRIGPMLFHQAENEDAIKPRTDAEKRRSVPYIMTYTIEGVKQKMPEFISATKAQWVPKDLELGDFAPGVPLPFNGKTPAESFWLTNPDSAIGGKLTDADGVQFGVPNLVYDFYDKSGFMNTGYTDKDAPLFKVQMSKLPSGQGVGLYSKGQFVQFRGDLTSTMTSEALEHQVARVRAATLYESANYLIPVPWEQFGDSDSPANLGHFGQIVGQGVLLSSGVMRYKQYVYAPLYGEEHDEILYKTPSEILSAISEFMVQQETGILKYRNSMNAAAKKVKEQVAMQSSAVKAADYTKAAAGISDIWKSSGAEGVNPKSCSSLTGAFMAFFYGAPFTAPTSLQPLPTGADCPDALGKQLQEYFTAGEADPSFSPSHYLMEYSWFPSNFPGDKFRVLSAYMPGPYTGVGMDGVFDNLATVKEMMRRNFYSTKLIQVNSVRGSSGYDDSNGLWIHSEGDQSGFPNTKQTNFSNRLSTPEEDTSSIQH